VVAVEIDGEGTAEDARLYRRTATASCSVDLHLNQFVRLLAAFAPPLIEEVTQNRNGFRCITGARR
jgi:hypothetical protein